MGYINDITDFFSNLYDIITILPVMHRFMPFDLQYILGNTMGRKGREPNHVPQESGTNSNADLLLYFEDGIVLERHSKYRKKNLKELRQRCSESGARNIPRY